jgi:hypothetical protein
MENFIFEYQMQDTSICDKVIDYHKNESEYKRQSTADRENFVRLSTDVPVYAKSSNIAIVEYQNYLIGAIEAFKNKYKFFRGKIIFDTSWLIQHYQPNEGFLTWHHERSHVAFSSRVLTFMTYLNDVTDGGETEFYYQDIKFKPKKGLTLIWPTEFTHTHRGITSKTQEKYIATGWLKFTHE